MPHPAEHSSVDAPLEADESERIAEAMTAFTAPSRVRLLYAMATGERTVDELADAALVSGPVASQQLRVLRQIGAVTVRREGRNAFYALRDHHMRDLLAAVRHHNEHDAHSSVVPAQRTPVAKETR